MNAYSPPVSIIINTDGRAAILRNTIESLRYLRWPRLELVVVPGPTGDGTRELLKEWQGEIKVGYCPTRNIAQSRNIGIELAAGEVIAFVDDDEVPEPEWLEDLVPLLRDPAVAVAGGWLVDHTGKDFQARFETVDRLGNVKTDWERAAPEFNFPLSYNVPHAMINSAFRRSALVDVCGFDEEFEYLLDETDLMIRFVDLGWNIVQTSRGLVHHKYLPSAVRNHERVLTNWYSMLKNKTYFALVHGRRFAGLDRILSDISRYFDESRREMEGWIKEKLLPPEARAQFDRDADEALRDGLIRGLRGVRRLGDRRRLAGEGSNFLPFRTHLPPSEQRCFIFLAGPDAARDGGLGELAARLAAAGHQVHLLTGTDTHDRIDFEDGLWVHRLRLREFPPEPVEKGEGVPLRIWNRSRTMLAEAEEILRRRPVAAVCAPLGEGAAVAFLGRPKLPLVVMLGDNRVPEDRAVLAAECRVLRGCDGLSAARRETISAIERGYGVSLEHDRVAVLPAVRSAAQEVELLLQAAVRRGFPERSAAAE